MYLHCPGCDSYFDTDTTCELDPEGIVCGVCMSQRPMEDDPKPVDDIDRLIALADEHQDPGAEA
jgi:hypothetical protein